MLRKAFAALPRGSSAVFYTAMTATTFGPTKPDDRRNKPLALTGGRFFSAILTSRYAGGHN